MAKVFLDTNYLMDIFMRKTRKLADTGPNDLYASPLSFHIISYVHKLNTPNQQLIDILQDIATITLSNNILNKALLGPTSDLEDNLQLHSAIEENCQYFLTGDKLLLKMSYFGKMQIVNSL